jgi:RimJ/RimL family protein N-acetyltransferase
MNVVEYADAPTLWREAEAFLSRDPANNTHQLSAIKRVLDLGARGGERFFAVRDFHDELVGSAVLVDTQTLFLSVMTCEVVTSLAAHLRDAEGHLAGAIGRRDVLDTFTATFAKPSRILVNLMLYRLERDPDFGRAAGGARLATMDDLPLLIDWHAAFEQEVGMIKVQTPLEERVTRRIKDQQLSLWISDGIVVSFAGANALPASSARVGPVYTPPELRGRSYAQAITAAVSLQVQRDKTRTVFLNTDAANPASNKAYQRIGYRHIADHAHLLFYTPR